MCKILRTQFWTACRHTFASCVTVALYHNVTEYVSVLWRITSMFYVHMNQEFWTSQGSFPCSEWKSLPCAWTTIVATHNSMPGCESILAFHLCVWILFMWFQKLKVSCLVIFSGEGTFKRTTDLLSRGAGPIPWPGYSCEFALLDLVFWDYVREPVDIFLIEKIHWIWTCFETCCLLGLYAA